MSSGRSRGGERGAPASSPWRLWRWPLVLMFVALLAFAAYWLTLHQAASGVRATADAAGSAVEAVAERAGRIAEGFFSGDVTERFVSEMPEVKSAGQGRLEVATAEIVETLSRSDERRMFWDTLPLGTTTVEVQVPVTYRYHLRLEETWKIEVRGPVCLVVAPVIRPSLPPALHTDRMLSRTEESWLRFDGGEKLEELRRSLTPRLEQRARSPHHVDLVRESARETVANFVRQWLIDQEFWVDDRFATVRVVFADEVGGDGGEGDGPAGVTGVGEGIP